MSAARYEPDSGQYQNQKLFEVYTDGAQVWAVHDGQLAAIKPIGQDVDGYRVALVDTVRDVARTAAEEVCG